jgi:ammonia channel protein AmtB
LKTHVGIFLFDMRSLCNGFLAGVAAMSVGSAGMQAYWAVLCGAITAPLYVGSCLLFRAF